MLNKIKIITCIFFVFFSISIVNSLQIFADKAHYKKNTIYFFYSPDCEKCIYIEKKYLPEILNKYSLNIIKIPMINEKNYKILSKFEKNYGDSGYDFPVIFFNGKFFTGKKQILEEFEKSLINVKIKIKPHKKKKTPNLITVIIGGLIDGINPCAFTVIIFMISYLALAGNKPDKIFLTGMFFIIGCFITYLLIGICADFFFKTALKNIKKADLILKILFSSFLFLLAGISFLDFISLKKKEKPTNKLSNKSILKIHKIIKNFSNKKNSKTMVIISFVSGMLIALIEFPCTGQIYLPIILLIRKSFSKGIYYLLLYNICFIIPLLIVLFLTTIIGSNIEKIGKKYSKKTEIIKIISGILFLSLAIILLIN